MIRAVPRSPTDVRIVITGGARGRGQATAREVASLGASVLITGVLDDEGHATASKLGGNMAYTHHDVTSAESW